MLAVGVAAGDRAAAEMLVLRYQRLVRSFLLKLCHDSHLADDLAQETLLRMLRHADRYDPQYPMRTWLLTIARRLLINHSRRADSRVGHSEFPGLQHPAAGPAERAAALDEQLATRRRLDAAMQQLNETQRSSLVLFYEQDLSVQEMARVLDMPVGTVKSHLHRARAALRAHLAPHYETVTP